MQGMTKRGSVYYARLIIPKDRWADTGRVTGARNGTRRDIVKSLETKDYREALRRRDTALSAMREAINQALSAHNLPPLHGSWSPSLGSSLQTHILEQALKARKDLESADDYRTPEYLNDDPSEGIVVSESFSSRDFGADIVNEALAQAANRIAAQYPGSKGQRMADEAYHQAHDIAFGLTTPLSILLDRWLPQLEGNVTQELIDRHHRGFSRLGQYLAESQCSKTSDREGFVRTIAIETIDKKVVGHFREWLEALPGIGPRVVASHLSTMNTFWKWAEQVGYAETNPWLGSTHGLKKKIAKASIVRGEKRPYHDDEIVCLIEAARERMKHPKKWPWARIIHDMLLLAPLTGCRQNELASLTAARVIQSSQPDQLWRISVTEEVSKTRSSTREVPLHPIAQTVIAQRLSELPEGHSPDTMLFPECKPGGRDNKPGHYLSKRYASFLKSVLGEKPEIDFHSFRRCFATFFTQAEACGATHCSGLVLDHLLGHKPVSLAHNTYAAKRFDWSTYDRAIMEMVEKGIPPRVIDHLKRALGRTLISQ